MAMLVLAGMSHRPLLLSRDSLELEVEQAVATKVLELRHEHEEARDVGLANRITSGVGERVGRALNQALQAIAKAMSG